MFIQYESGLTLSSVLTSPERSISVLKACWFFPGFSYRSLFARMASTVQSDPVVKRSSKFYRILVFIVFVEIDRIYFRSFLEKPVLIMPWSQFSSFNIIPFCKIGINIILKLCKVIPCQVIKLVKDLSNFCRILT